MSRFSSFRAVLSATAISAALLAISAAQALAGGVSGPFPK
jgi:hypothetical protein